MELTDYIIHELRWSAFTLFILSCREGTISVEIYEEPQGISKVSAYICNFWVKVEYRHLGFGTELIERAERIVRERCVAEVSLVWRAADSSVLTIRWYERIGYKKVFFNCAAFIMKKKLIETA